MRPRFKFRFTLLIFFLFAQACGDLSTKANFSISMLGVSSAPLGATGAYEPQSESFIVQSITLQDSDGTSHTLYEGTKAFSIIDRPQIIYSGDLDTALEGKDVSNLTVVFSTAVTANSRYAKELSLTLASASTSYAGPISIVKGKDYKFLVNVAWQNTVTRVDKEDTISVPSLSMSVEN